MSPLRLDSFKNSEALPKPVVTSESEGKTPPVLREGERGMPELEDSRHPAAPLDDRGPAELDARASRLSRTLERIMRRAL